MGKKYATGNNQLTKFDNYRPNNIKGIDLTINNQRIPKQKVTVTLIWGYRIWWCLHRISGHCNSWGKYFQTFNHHVYTLYNVFLYLNFKLLVGCDN